MTGTSKRNSILIVDDDSSILKALKRALQDEDYEVFTANEWHETVDLLAKHTFSVVISDFLMPGICGDDLLNMVQSKSPRTIRVMLSGNASTKSVPATIAAGILHCQIFISKPWDDDELRKTIRECIAEYEAAV
ncbi:MAG TPA: response regulator [candidate division Zixibacteria bacterium]|nr:response regulator [candidate division Zixibacteria bacterium]